MKPSFALNFTDDSIQLLHRTGKGWVPVGETLFAAPDLDDALDYMRKTALGLEPGGFTTKLVIPNSQIRYLEIEAPGPSEDERRAQIRAGLEGKTPYPVEDLVFDWSGKGKSVRVAVLARETLEEAEAFATAHRFNPASFAAIPDYGDFSGEPWFGEAAGLAALLKPGEKLERDRNVIRVLTRDLPKAAGDAAAGEPPPEPAAAPRPEPQPEPAPLAEAPVAEDKAPVLAAEPVAESVMAQPEEAPAASLAAAMAEAPPPPEAVAPELAAPEPAAPAAAAEEAPFTHVPDIPAFPEEDDTPSVGQDDIPPLTAATPAAPIAPVAPVAAPRPAEDDDLPPMPSNAAMVAFASRRGAEGGGRAPAVGAAARPDPAALARAARGKPIEDLPPMPRPPQAGARPSGPAAGGLRGTVAKGIGGLVVGATAPGPKKAKVKPGALPAAPSPRAAIAAAAAAPAGAAAGPADAARSLTRPGGTFGTKPPARSRSRTVLFLSLVAVLLLCLALLAAWSSFYLASGGDQTATDPAVAAADPAAEPVGASLPAVEDEMLADGEGDLIDGPAATDPVAEDPAADLAAAEPAPEPVAEPAPEPVAAPPEETAVSAPAPDTAVSSESPASQPLSETQDEIFLATADAPPPALDALSLPAPEAAADALPAPQMPPPPFGTVYAFDEKGLLKPTPEGIVSPEGVMLIAGKPPRVPPSRSEAATAAAAAAKAEAAAQPDAPPDAAAMVEALPVGAAAGPEAQPNPDLADRRPKPRPEGLVPGADDAALALEPAASFASLRPRSRPATILAAGEQARLETQAASLAAPAADPAQAEAELAAAAAAEAANPSVVAISRRPAARPDDFDQAVEAAVAAAIRAPAPEPEPEPEAKPEKAAKKEPAPDLKPEEQDEADEPEVAAAAAPKIPTKASVAKQATFKNALNLSKLNLIGVYGTQSKRYALIRQANGKYKKIKVGDRIDGGRVEAITQNEVRYQKGGRLISLKMPKG